uniref:Oplophorus-luciferin 2-monooxygenase non-catalytic subunit-like n=1 Tax=Hirondellea gigas TaxID=1518452 RepID=A0A6A7FW69_9CRUS
MELNLQKLLFFASLTASLYEIGAIPVDGTSTSTSWPCPDKEAIYPCTCSSDVAYNLNMDCSLVKGDQQLRDIFSFEFPFDDISTFYISDNKNISVLSANLFGEKSFIFINIVGTSLDEIDANVFADSHETLASLNLEHDELTEFAFDVISQYKILVSLKLNDNKLGTLPSIQSNTLRSLIMNSNPGLKLVDGELTFEGLPNLETIKLINTDLTSIVPNLFSKLNYIRNIYLSSNNIHTIEEYSINAPLDSIEMLYIADNSITTINVGAITGLRTDAELDLSRNLITEMTEEVWRPILEQMSGIGNLILDDNPLFCGCDMYWIVQDEKLWRQFSPQSSCHAGGNVITLSKEQFDFMCGS